MTTVAVPVSWQADLTASARRLSAVVAVGLAAGAAIGGVGGRLAMLVLRLTSSDSLHGLESDDGFVMGQVSGSTLFLIMLTGALGVVGALFYFAVRGWIPAGSRAAWTGVFGAAVGGAGVVHPDGIDFNMLEPLWLAVAFFVALPAAYGVTMSVLVERALRRDAQGRPAGGRAWIVGLIPLIALAIAGTTGLVVLVLLAGAWWLRRSLPQVAALWRSTALVWAGRVALLAFTVWSGWLLVRDATQIL
ncbi:MAG TPA: hypothetical protein VIE12_08200 [Actinomycetota bacterium]